MATRISPFHLTLVQAVVLVALVAASAVTQGVRAAEYTVTDLGPLGGGESYAAGVNESGQVVGEFATGSESSFHGFLYRGGTLTDLDTLGGSTSAAYGINTAGQVVGESDTLGIARHAFLYSGGDMTSLGTLGGTHSVALAINAAGQVVGVSDTPGNVARRAFLYRNEAMTDLGTLGGTHSAAYGINAAGQVVGSSQIPGDGAYHAFLYSDGTRIPLDTLGGTHSVAHGINALGQVVGQSQIPGDGAYHAFLYSDGAMIDLNDLVPAEVTVTNATGINTAGQIVGAGRIGGSTTARALLLTPIVLDRFAYALADAHTAESYTPGNAYNASGGASRITRLGVGRYDVAFDNLPTSGTDVPSAVAVTAHGSPPTPITCSVVAYNSASPSRTVVQVGCVDVGTQLAADSPFTILVVGNKSLPVPSAFVRTGGPAPDPVSSWTSIPNRSPAVTHTGSPGEYNVDLGTGNARKSAKLVTGTTGVGTRCYHTEVISGGLRVRCYDQQSSPKLPGSVPFSMNVVVTSSAWHH